MTITTESPAATADDKRAEIAAFLDRMKADGVALLDRANRTLDPDEATAQGVAAADMFERIHQIGKAVEEALAGTDDPGALDLDALQASITRQRPDTFKVGTPYHASKGMFQWTCTDTLIELRGARPRTLAPLKPGPTSELTWSDYFAGAGGSSSGIRRAFQVLSKILGGRVALAVNHWPLAIETHNHNHPDTDHDQASLARTHPSRYPRTDFAWFSPECFPAGTTILTRRGIIPIEQVKVGDEVLTHKLRWRPVTDVMSKVSDTVIVSGYGHPGIETTAEHPFYARTSKASYSTRKGGKPHRVPRSYGEADWVKAGDLAKGHYWSAPTEFGEAGDIPAVGGRGMVFHGDFWWMVGRWLGDGCFRASRGEVQITCGHHEADALEKRLAAVAPAVGYRASTNELRWTRRDIRTATVFTARHADLVLWLRDNFGEHADGKTMPAWALSMHRRWRSALLAGYVSADGGQYDMPDNQRPIVVCSSVSRSLAMGVRLLALSLGHKASLILNHSRTEGVIEGRTVKMRPLWRVQWSADPSPKHDQTLLEDGIRWAPVREVKPGRTAVEVFNLSVAEDESYVADAVIVHNCTFWSVARGDKCDYDLDSEQQTLGIFDEEDDTPEAKEAKWRSRMLMRDVVRFSRWHQYKAVIVENVPDILKWAAMDRWLAEMVAEGYRYKILTLNSAFSGVLGPSAPQLRDRVYVIFWKACYKTPNWNKWLRPKGYCPGCEQVVDSIYTAKPGPRRAMRYGPRAQYTYRCPKKACNGRNVRPMVRPASSAIDFTLPSQRIGDRKRPLARKTYDRVAAGVNLYFNTPLLTPAGGSRYDTAIPVTDPMRTFTTRESHAVVVPMEGRGPVSSIRPLNTPFRTSTGRHQDALLEHPESFIAPLRNNGNPEPTTAPMRTFAANGYHHALVMRNNSGGSEMSTPIGEPIRTLTTLGHQSLVTDGQDIGHTLFSYDTGLMRPLDEPLPAQTTVQGDAVVTGRRFIDVDDCYLRMLAIEEIQAGMAFDLEYVLLGSSKRDKAKMLGNAVTWNTARDLAAMVMEAVTGDDYPIPASAALWLPN